MNTVSTLSALYLTFLVGLLSPGPDFAIVLRQSRRFGRIAAVPTALGIALGVLIHVTIISFAMGYMSRDPWNLALRILGASYLLYLGFDSVRGAFTRSACKPEREVPTCEPGRKTFLKLLRTGLLTNVLNAKAAAFFISLFSSIAVLDAGPSLTWLMAFLIATTAFCWFLLLGNSFSGEKFNAAFQKHHRLFNLVTGTALSIFGLMLLLV